MITWDKPKRVANLRKHGLDFIDSEEVFDGVTYTYEDDRLAYGEQRFVTLGAAPRGRGLNRPHGRRWRYSRHLKRKATKREREIYFESIAN